jgi:hypothetical protein
MSRSLLVAVPLLVGMLAAVPVALAQGGSIVQDGKANNWRCYDFEVKNIFDPHDEENKRNIKDIHFRFPSGFKPEHMKAPDGWGWTAGPNDSLSFETPPANARGTVSPNPIKPGEPALDMFRFCLKQETKEITIETSYDRGANSPVEVFQGKQADSEIPVRRTSRLHCIKLKITAPAEMAVFDIHFHESASPDFDGFDLPQGWTAQALGKNAAEIDLGDASLAGGKSEEVGVCLRGDPEEIKWTFTDKDHKEIKGSAGTTGLKL